MLALANNLLERLSQYARATSRVIAWLLGAMLLVTIFFIVAEVATRKLFGFSFRFVHEYSGYMLAIFTSWGLAHTLFEKAHIRIDIAYTKAPMPMRRALDLLAIAAMAGAGLAIAWFAWSVLGRSLANQSTSNTSLSTPMWIPHMIWFAGYVWFSLVCVVLVLRAVIALLARDMSAFDEHFSAHGSETTEIEGL
ncbi:MAG: TRAP transporter small permease [Natronospirillum sp.]|uniref:TRAP transporter small permease subunit n=1 Tax=Natronospirillum sp. TaxID=2812955 RepID=UPI0025D05653|nr:TRAP transporter small permease [Natronospirillum sp.]MCH8550735.1 TRAP transporter small permease [Natronospirillum sp.]